MSELVTASPFPPDDEPQPRLYLLSDLLPGWLDEIERRHEARRTGRPLGAVTAFPSLDALLGGYLSNGVHALHGQTGTGKTAFALQVAAQSGVPTLYATCEIPPDDLLSRITARVTQTSLRRLRNGEVSRDEAEELAVRAIAATPGLLLMDGTRHPIRMASLQIAARVARDRIGGPPAGPEGAPADRAHVLVVVDSVHTMAESLQDRLTEYEALNTILAGLRHLAAALECPVLALVERNRACMTTGGLSAGAGTRKIEYGAESVLDLRRDLDTPPDAAGEVPVALSLPKNRNGAAGTEVKLLFHGLLQRFREAA